MGIFIPAHNEARSLQRSLAALAAQDFQGPVELVVAANGCSDETVAVAHAGARDLPENWRLTVVETPVAAKWAALNAAETAVGAGSRIYLDADVLLSPNAVRTIAASLDTDEPRLVQPRIEVGPLDAYGGVVRSFIRVWSSLPYIRNEVLGVGCYAVNASGRSRWEEFPALGADDTFVRLRFERSQKRVLRDATMTIFFPRSLRELVRVRARWCRLGREVRRRERVLPETERRRWQRAFGHLATKPPLWLDGVVFSLIWICAVLLSFSPGLEESWARASTSSMRV